jgi:hypothetical protein
MKVILFGFEGDDGVGESPANVKRKPLCLGEIRDRGSIKKFV